MYIERSMRDDKTIMEENLYLPADLRAGTDNGTSKDIKSGGPGYY